MALDINRMPENGKKLVLIGFMGAGKSSVAKLLAEELDMDFLELDQEILGASGKASITEIFETEGEEYFRKLESEALEQAIDLPKDLVVSTGGGAAANSANQLLLGNLAASAEANVIYLAAEFDTIKKRIADSHDRPLFMDLNNAQALYKDRQSIYEDIADVKVDTDNLSIEEVVNKIKEHLCQ